MAQLPPPTSKERQELTDSQTIRQNPHRQVNNNSNNNSNSNDNNNRLRLNSSTSTSTTTDTPDKYRNLIRDILSSPSIHSVRSDSICNSSNGDGSIVLIESSISSINLEDTNINNQLQRQQKQHSNSQNICSVPLVEHPEEQSFYHVYDDAHTAIVIPTKNNDNNITKDGKILNVKKKIKQSNPRPRNFHFNDYLHRILRYIKLIDILILIATFLVTMILLLILRRPVPPSSYHQIDLTSILLFILIWLSLFVFFMLIPTFKRWFFYWNPGFSLTKPS